MKHLIRAFSLGLFAAGFLLVTIYYFFDTPEKSAEDLTEEDMISDLKDKGYRVITEAEYITLSVQGDDSDQNEEAAAVSSSKNEKDEKQESKTADKKQQQAKDEKVTDTKKSETKNKQEKKKAKPKTYTIEIKSGMPTSEIGDMLAAKGIIKDAGKFNKYMEKEGYETRVQLGKFKISTGMDYHQIAEAITR